MIRAFIAFELPESIQTNLRNFQQTLRGEPFADAIRFVPVEKIHLTLKFLGDIEHNRVQQIHVSLKNIARAFPMLSLAVGEPGCFPNHRRPRVLWVGLQEADGYLERLQRAIEGEMENLGFEPEGRRFHPHLTLGRVKKAATTNDISAIGRWVTEVEAPNLGVFKAQEIHLIQSKLTPQGAIYSTLGSAALLGET